MFLNNWNEYFFAALLTTSDKNRTLPVALQFFNESFSYDYTKLFAALTIVVLPGIILYAFTQEQVQESLAATGIKG
jgi:raffinose/stachyose/melibiose transport system permease protein